MKKSLFVHRNGEPNPIYITQLSAGDLGLPLVQLSRVGISEISFDVMECQDDKGDFQEEVFYSHLTDKSYKHKEGMLFESI